jgi:DUF1707 SHOCT-like domain
MSELRAADSDRERTAERLRTAAAEGRLSAEELEQRLEVALAARTNGELEAVVADLPAVAPRPAPRIHPEQRAFVLTSVLLVAIWALTGAGYFWPVWPILGWGLFVLPPGRWLGFPACRRNASSRH